MATSTSLKVKISDLKAHLSKYLRKVQNGSSLTVLDRETPIAVLSPPPGRTRKQPVIRKGGGRLGSLKLQPAMSVRTDSLALLLDDRSRR